MNENVKKILKALVVIILLVWTLLPIYWMIITSVKQGIETAGEVQRLPYPPNPTLDNYNYILFRRGYIKYLTNSLIIAGGNTALVLLVSVPAAYAFVRSRFQPLRHLQFWFLTNRMAPAAAFFLPVFTLFAALKLSGTYYAMWLAYCVFNIPLAVWMLIAAISAVPRELEEAAMIDGLSQLGAIRRIVLPLIRRSLVVVGLLVFLFAWNHYLFGLVLSDAITKPMPVAIGDFALATSEGAYYRAYVACQVTVLLIPVLIILAVVRRNILLGFGLGRV
ncbi:MAG: carbohydrate ABC transporter permease [Crenarchaeota archaeon]|nr:carbohydrate ABC transporter permease [Thermoproteota archaeon]